MAFAAAIPIIMSAVSAMSQKKEDPAATGGGNEVVNQSIQNLQQQANQAQPQLFGQANAGLGRLFQGGNNGNT